jgi:hypothetical protein
VRSQFRGKRITTKESVFRIRIQILIRIHRIHMFLGLPDLDPLVKGMVPDPDIRILLQILIRIHRIHMFLGLPDLDTSQRYGSGS